MECSICYGLDGDDFMILDCDKNCKNNVYHKFCIEKWFQIQREVRCPYCRREIAQKKKAIKYYVLDQKKVIVTEEYERLSYGNFYYPFMLILYGWGIYHKILHIAHFPLSTWYMYNLDIKKWTVEKMLGIEFFSFTSFYIMYMLFLKHNFHIDASPYPLFLMFDLISLIYTRYRISKMEEPYGLLENIPEHLIHPSVRSIIRPDQWIYIQKND